MEERFIIEKVKTSRMTVFADVITDTKTGVQYLAYADNTRGANGIVPLLDTDGKPLIECKI